MRSSRLRYPLFLIVIVMLISGGWAALQRAGWSLPTFNAGLVGLHGPLMICGVFGTLISLERAVALSSATGARGRWAFLAPILSGLGGILMIAGVGLNVSQWCFVVASAITVAIYLYTAITRHYWTMYAMIMAFGAGLWFAGNVLWATGQPVFVTVHLWMAFIVLTIVGERLELSRVTRLTRRSGHLLAGSVAVYVCGVLLAIFSLGTGIRIAGAGMVLMALWLIRYDVASKRLGASGLTRYIALCLFSGYIWLGIAGIMGIGFGAVYAGYQYDALIHAVVVGFILSMVFGHAPMIFPALTGRHIAYTALMYVPLAMLHLSLVIRLISDFSGSFEGRMLASMINAAAVILFLMTMVYGAMRNLTPRSPLSVQRGEES